MVKKKPAQGKRRLSRDEWLQAALKTMRSAGVDGVKVAPLAARLGVTTGSFYWHFKNRRDLLEEMLDYWERVSTEQPIEKAKRFEGSPRDRILLLMKSVMVDDLGGYDLPIWLWSQSDGKAQEVFQRVLKKRFAFSASMFRQAGFSRRQAEIRGRMMVVYLMGESSLVSRSVSERLASIRQKQAILTSPT